MKDSFMVFMAKKERKQQPTCDNQHATNIGTTNIVAFPLIKTN